MFATTAPFAPNSERLDTEMLSISIGLSISTIATAKCDSNPTGTGLCPDAYDQ